MNARRLAVLLVPAAVLAGCAHNTPAVTSAAADSRYLAAIRTEARTVTFTDWSVVTLGHAICAQLDSGVGMGRVSDLMIEARNEVSTGDVRVLLTDAVTVLCPAHRWAL